MEEHQHARQTRCVEWQYFVAGPDGVRGRLLTEVPRQFQPSDYTATLQLRFPPVSGIENPSPSLTIILAERHGGVERSQG